MLGSLGMMGQWVFDRFVMASGKSSLFLFTLSAASVTNLILDPIFIFGYFGFPAMGTAGAALATITGQWAGCFAGYFINRRFNREIPIVAYNYGAKKPERIYGSCRWAMLYSVVFYSVFFLVMEIIPKWVLLLFDASEEMLAIGVTALRIMAVSYLLSNICLTYSAAFQGLGMGVQSMMLTLSRQVVLPVVFIAVLSRLGNLSLIWMAFALAEAVVIPFGVILWRKECASL